MDAGRVRGSEPGKTAARPGKRDARFRAARLVCIQPAAFRSRGGSEGEAADGRRADSRAREIANFATQRKLVSLGTSSVHVEAGGLIFYGSDISALYDRTASFVDRILRGTPAGSLPVEQPTQFELVVNTKTAKTLGIKFPQSILVRADEVLR